MTAIDVRPRTSSFSLCASARKYPRSNIFSTEVGTLFVPLLGMWGLHDLTRDLRVRSWPELPIAVLYRKIKEQAPADLALPASVQLWWQQYKHIEWYGRWLLRGQDAPADVFIPTSRVLKLCSRAWHPPGICQVAGVESQTYDAWFKERTIPDIRWLKWLYGQQAPADCFEVGLELQQLRKEGTEVAICAAAHVYGAGPREWRRDPFLREALERTMQAASRSGGHLPTPRDWAAWEEVPAKTRDLISRYAQAAIMNARCKRVGKAFAGFNHAKYCQVLTRAKRVGAQHELHEFINRAGAFAQQRGLMPSGLIARNLFVPTPAMIRFRQAAQKKQVWYERVVYRQKQVQLKDVPGFDAWFLDWTVPRKWSGNRRTLPSSRSEGNPDRKSGAIGQPGLTREEPGTDRTSEGNCSGGEATERQAANTHGSISVDEAIEKVVPRWDSQRRELWFGAVLCKRYKRAAPNQILVIEAFQEQNWISQIADPLSPGKLADTIGDLQDALGTTPIVFERDGTGKGITWRVRG
jgi:hypothetical protein